MRRLKFVVSASRWLAAGCAALSLAGCGALIGAQHSCESTFGLTEPKKVTCTGSVDTVRGSPSLGIVEIGEDLDGAFLLETTITVGQGTAKAHVTDVDDRRAGGEVSPGQPLEIKAVVYPEPATGTDEDEEQVEVQLGVKEGREVTDLRYEPRWSNNNSVAHSAPCYALCVLVRGCGPTHVGATPGVAFHSVLGRGDAATVRAIA